MPFFLTSSGSTGLNENFLGLAMPPLFVEPFIVTVEPVILIMRKMLEGSRCE
jgi:hypothetical protein